MMTGPFGSQKDMVPFPDDRSLCLPREDSGQREHEMNFWRILNVKVKCLDYAM